MVMIIMIYNNSLTGIILEIITIAGVLTNILLLIYYIYIERVTKFTKVLSSFNVDISLI